MTIKHEFIQTQQHDKESLAYLREQGAFITLSRIVVTTDDGEYHFHDLARLSIESAGRRDITHHAAIGPGGALQIVSSEAQRWPSQEGPIDLDPETRDGRPLTLRVDWTISRVFSPSYWKDVSAVNYGSWYEASKTEKWFSRSKQDPKA